eukprot:2190645-Pleurochrysis_carterae.AAC.3
MAWMQMLTFPPKHPGIDGSQYLIIASSHPSALSNFAQVREAALLPEAAPAHYGEPGLHRQVTLLSRVRRLFRLFSARNPLCSFVALLRKAHVQNRSVRTSVWARTSWRINFNPASVTLLTARSAQVSGRLRLLRRDRHGDLRRERAFGMPGGPG